MTQKHTPGPWQVNFRADGSSLICMGGTQPGQAHKQFDLLLERGNGNDEADANLIAAAPELLAALDGLVRTFAAILDDPSRAPEFGVVKTANAAIAKARGPA